MDQSQQGLTVPGVPTAGLVRALGRSQSGTCNMLSGLVNDGLVQVDEKKNYSLRHSRESEWSEHHE